MATDYSVKVVIEAINKASGPLKAVQRQLQSLKDDAGFRAMRSSVAKVQTSLAGVGNELGLVTQRLAVFGVAAGAAFASLVGPASELENLKFSLDKLYGSTKKGDEILSFITDFAKTSPYGIRTIADSLARFKGQDFNSLDQFKNILNYLAVYVPDEFRASNALIQLSQAWGKAKLQMADIRPIIEAGVPVWKLLSDATGKTTAQLQEMSSKGQITRDVMLKLFTLMGQRSGNASGEIFKLWSTKISNLRDVWDTFSYRLLNIKVGDLSFFERIKADVQGLTDQLAGGLGPEKMQAIAKAVTEVYTAFKDIVTQVAPALVEIGGVLQAAAKAVGGWGNLFKLTIGVLLLPLLLSVGGAIVSIVGLIGTAAVAIAPLIPAIVGIVATVSNVALGVLSVVTAIGVAIVAVNAFALRFKPIKTAVDGITQAFQGWGRLIGGAIGSLGALVPRVEFGASAPKAFAGKPLIPAASRTGVAQGSRDTLHLKMEVDNKGGARVTDAKYSGDKKFKFEAKTGLNMQPAY